MDGRTDGRRRLAGFPGQLPLSLGRQAERKSWRGRRPGLTTSPWAHPVSCEKTKRHRESSRRATSFSIVPLVLWHMAPSNVLVRKAHACEWLPETTLFRFPEADVALRPAARPPQSGRFQRERDLSPNGGGYATASSSRGPGWWSHARHGSCT